MSLLLCFALFCPKIANLFWDSLCLLCFIVSEKCNKIQLSTINKQIELRVSRGSINRPYCLWFRLKIGFNLLNISQSVDKLSISHRFVWFLSENINIEIKCNSYPVIKCWIPIHWLSENFWSHQWMFGAIDVSFDSILI